MRILTKHLTLNEYYNVTNRTHLATDLTNLKISEKPQTDNIRHQIPLCQHPHKGTLTITKSKLTKNNDTQITQQTITLMRLVLLQNYFILQNKIHETEKGVSMGPTISSTTLEIFLQHLEDTAASWHKQHNILYTLRRRYTDCIWHHKNTPWPHQYIHKPNTYRHTAQPHIWK